MHESYADVLESYTIDDIATEGIGVDLLKLAGKGVLKILKCIGIFFAITIGIASIAMIRSNRHETIVRNRLADPTPDEKLSRQNYLHTWVPEIQKFQKMVAKDINDFNKRYDIKKFLYEKDIIPDNPEMRSGYGAYVAGLKYETIQHPEADGDDDPDPIKAQEFTEKLKELKPLINKWKNAARVFYPYFELMVSVEDENENYPWFEICLSCKWVDKYGIIRPGLPEFGKK